MSRRTDAELIERALDRAAEEPDRVGALKRLVRQRMTASLADQRMPVASAEAWDDHPWDNVPV